MQHAKRHGPVQFDAVAAEVAERQDWRVVLAYEGEGQGPWLVDLSHRQRWDFQHSDLDSQAPFGLQVPAKPGQVSVQRELLISRMNGTQVAIWRLGQGEAEPAPNDTAYTDMTDAHCMLAVLGADTPHVMEHLSKLDLLGLIACCLDRAPVNMLSRILVFGEHEMRIRLLWFWAWFGSAGACPLFRFGKRGQAPSPKPS